MEEVMVNRKAAELFSETFQKIEEETFYHKHFGNPDRIEEPVYFFEKENKMCAMNAFDQVKMKVGGKEVFGVQSSDSAVDKTCRGQGLFFRIQSEFSEKYKERGGSLEFGFPNDNSFPIFIKKLGWSHVGTLSERRMPVSFTGCLKSLCFGGGRKRTVLQNNDGEIRQYFFRGFSVCCGRGTELISENDLSVLNKGMKVGVKRTAAYYDWKMSVQKEDWKVIKIEREGHLLAFFLILRKKSRHFMFGEIIDWYVNADASRKEYHALKRMICRECREWCDIAVIPYLNPQSGEEETVRKIGFFLKGEGRERLIVKCLDRTIEGEVLLPENWTVRKLDSDTLQNGQQ